MNAYQYDCFISFNYADPAGIVFFGHVFTLAHHALEQWIMSYFKCSWQHWFQNPDWIVPIKKSTATYFQPLYAGCVCNINIHIKEYSTSSLTLHFQFFQNQLCCSVDTVHVFCHRLNKQKIPIPAELYSHLMTD